MNSKIAKEFFWEFYAILMQNFSDILLLFCTPTGPSQHVSENQEFTEVEVNSGGYLPSREGKYSPTRR